ncbi:MAG: hypothetical protein ABL995_02215 [Bryobacteraceae bacterium]
MNDSNQLIGRQIRSVVVCVSMLSLILFCVSAQERTSALPAVPLEPIAAIVDAFRSHDIVAMDEGNHGNEQGHAFRVSLIRDERFIRSVNDIVVEVGSARYQDVMDRFTAGEDVPYSDLRKVWEDITQPHGPADRPIYEEFFRAVREVNASLPRERRLRVLLGEPPIDWDTVRTRDELWQWLLQRDTHAVEVIHREVLAKGRHALVVYGGMHLLRKPPEDGPGIVSRLERDGTKVFSIWTNTYADVVALQADAISWPKPSLAILRGTLLGAEAFAHYAPGERVDWRSRPAEEQFDALLYVGPPSTITLSRMSRSLCADADYLKMRFRRISLMEKLMGEQIAAGLRRYCDLPK